LTVVDQGKTLMNALQDAVTRILHVQGRNLRFNGLLDIALILDFFHQDMQANIQEKSWNIRCRRSEYRSSFFKLTR